METFLTFLASAFTVITWFALVVGLPIMLLYFVYQGVVKGFLSLFRKDKRSSVFTTTEHRD